MKMTTLYEIEPGKFNARLAEELEKMEEFRMPEWAFFVKTSTSRARPPQDEKFWYKRAASILRQAYIYGVIGVNKLRVKYGSRKKRGVRPEEFRKSGGKMIRTMLQQAEKAGFIEKSNGKRSGRQLTKKGKDFLDKIADAAK